MLKKLTLAISAAAVCGLSSHAAAETFASPVGEFDVSMTATLATDYIWRGQSQTSGTGAIQGSLDVAHESGLYAGIWASNVDAGNADIEVDYYVGYAHNFTDDIAVDLFYAAYTYPKQSDWDSQETGVSFSLYGATIGTKYTTDNDAGSHPTYNYIGYDFELPYDVTMSVAYGVTDAKDGADDYEDYTLAFSKTIVGLGFSLAYTDTSISDRDCVESYGKKDYCDSNLTLSVSKSF